MRRILLGLLGVLLLACSAPTPVNGPVEVELDEFYIEPEAAVIAAGTVDFVVFNEGEFPHTMVVAGESGQVVFASDVLNSGERMNVELDLVAGVYQLTCRIVVQLEDGQLIDHYQNGMGTAIEAVG